MLRRCQPLSLHMAVIPWEPVRHGWRRLFLGTGVLSCIMGFPAPASMLMCLAASDVDQGNSVCQAQRLGGEPMPEVTSWGRSQEGSPGLLSVGPTWAPNCCAMGQGSPLPSAQGTQACRSCHQAGSLRQDPCHSGSWPVLGAPECLAHSGCWSTLGEWRNE